MARVPESERWEIVELYFKGRSQRKIAEATGKALKTVNRNVRAFKSCRRIKDAPRKPRSGVTTEQEDAWIVAAAVVKPGLSAQYKPKFLQRVSKSGRSTVGVSGMITKDGLRPLVRIDERIICFAKLPEIDHTKWPGKKVFDHIAGHFPCEANHNEEWSPLGLAGLRAPRIRGSPVMNGEASDVSENDEEGFGWQVAAGRRSRAQKKSSEETNVAPCNSPASGGGAASATSAFKSRVVKDSRMAQLPEEHFCTVAILHKLHKHLQFCTSCR
ncbi:hypothetical protein HPB51_006719 [Rhipicephalus microplus]|uniref:Tick transposon n=1 Tax=Rhipicephalus microplus TaxID=6941 RepID=A0A9J6E751_RHIMP|nr:hypothetical protein HPB51_006719 [Rhipicephalus microplus]